MAWVGAGRQALSAGLTKSAAASPVYVAVYLMLCFCIFNANIRCDQSMLLVVNTGHALLSLLIFVVAVELRTPRK